MDKPEEFKFPRPEEPGIPAPVHCHPDDERPTITEREVSWYEAVAAHRAVKENASAHTQAARDAAAALALPLRKTQRVGALECEPYSFALSLLLESLRFPLEIGGRTDRAEIVLALVCFTTRGLAEGLVREHGAEKARALLLSPECQGEVFARITPADFAAFTGYLREQYGITDQPEGNTTAATAQAAA